MNQRPIEVLLVEDSPPDARLAREALMQGTVAKRITIVTDGAQAIDYVRRRGSFVGARRPDIVLLDLNLPKRDGLEVLEEIKSDSDLRCITVIVLTTSEFPKDVRMAYELSANCYIVKPPELEKFFSVMRGIEEFWMSLASLPTLSSDPLPRTGESPLPRPVPKDGKSEARSPGGFRRARVHTPRWVGIVPGRRASGSST